MGRRAVSSLPAIFLAPFLVCVLLVSPSSLGQSSTAPEGPGEEWELPEQHMIFLKGDEQSPFLDRNWSVLTGEPLGRAEFTRTSSSLSPNLIDIQSAPLSEALRFQGNITVQLFASLESSNDGCRVSNVLPGTAGAETSFTVSLSLGTSTVLTNAVTNSMAMEESFLLAHLFTVQASDVNVTLAPGDMISLRVDVQHDCLQSGVLWWGSFDARTGIVLEGEILEPSLEVVLDSNRMARVQFTPLSPWGEGDFDRQVLQIVGPMDWDEMIHENGDEDQRVDHFEIPHSVMIGDANRTVRVWSSEKPLEPGKYMIDGCFVLTDQNPGDTCHVVGVLRFEVQEDKDPLLGGFWAAILVPLSIVGWIGFSIREATLPLPAYAVIVLLAIAALGPASQLPDIDAEANGGRGAAPAFVLISHGSDEVSISLNELLEGSDAVVIGLFQAGSPYAEHQRGDFESAMIVMERDVSFVQIATGKDLKAVNIDGHAEVINESWPLLLDEADSSTGLGLPSGPTDAVIVVDPAGFVTSWSPGTMSSEEIKQAVESGIRGSGNSPLDLISMLFSFTLLPLFVLSLPSGREKEPEADMNPFAGSIMTTLAASTGFSIWAIPVSLLAFLGLSQSWLLVEILLSIVLTYHGLAVLTSGKIVEVEFISSFVHSKIPDEYANWRGLGDFNKDAYLGLWLAWLAWIGMPYLIPQGVGAVSLSGTFGTLLSIFLMGAFVLSAGVTVSLARAISAIPGAISVSLGRISMGIRPRAWGIATAVFGLWMSASLIVLASQTGL